MGGMVSELRQTEVLLGKMVFMWQELQIYEPYLQSLFFGYWCSSEFKLKILSIHTLTPFHHTMEKDFFVSSLFTLFQLWKLKAECIEVGMPHGSSWTSTVIEEGRSLEGKFMWERELSWISDKKANWHVQSIPASSFFSMLKGAKIARVSLKAFYSGDKNEIPSGVNTLLCFHKQVVKLSHFA